MNQRDIYLLLQPVHDLFKDAAESLKATDVALLAICAAEVVLPVWTAKFPDDVRPVDALRQTRKMLNTGDLLYASSSTATAAHDAWERGDVAESYAAEAVEWAASLLEDVCNEVDDIYLKDTLAEVVYAADQALQTNGWSLITKRFAEEFLVGSHELGEAKRMAVIVSAAGRKVDVAMWLAKQIQEHQEKSYHQ